MSSISQKLKEVPGDFFVKDKSKRAAEERSTATLELSNLGAGPAKKCYFVSRVVFLVNIDSLGIMKMLLKMLVDISS